MATVTTAATGATSVPGRWQQLQLGWYLRCLYVDRASKAGLFLPRIRAPHINPSFSLIGELFIVLGSPKPSSVIRTAESEPTQILVRELINSYGPTMFDRMKSGNAKFTPFGEEEQSALYLGVIRALSCFPMGGYHRGRVRYEGFPGVNIFKH